MLPALVTLNILVLILMLASAKPGQDDERKGEDARYEAVPLPDKVTFAGEAMPLDRFYVKEALDRELLSNAYFHSQTIRYIKTAPRYFSIIEPILKEHCIPDDFKYLAVAESGLHSSRSSAGAQGNAHPGG